MEQEEHKFIRKIAAELELSIKDVLLEGVKALAEKHCDLESTNMEDRDGREET
ncbi:MAG: hypothetical protein ACLFNL_09535 [Bacteroidales bacterium]